MEDENKKQLEDLNRELMVLNADYADLVSRLEGFSTKLHKIYEKINGKEPDNGNRR